MEWLIVNSHITKKRLTMALYFYLAQIDDSARVAQSTRNQN
nr:MAG TPA: hypothetical protein [Caudoviricetes sp.]